jgi:uncharacterized iron-regulated membrane protein
VTAWHRTIGATGEQRALGRSITGFANLGFLFIVCSGLFLWWPRTWTRARLRNIAMFRRNALGKARDFNWHNTLGVWSFLPLIAIVGSGVVMSYPWANALVYRVMGEQPPAPRGATQQRAGTSPRADRGSVDRAANSAPTHPSTLSLDSAISLGASRSSDWRTITIQLPSATATTVTASVDAGTGGQPQLRGSLVLDRATAEVVRWEPFSSQTPGRRLRSLLRFAHTGEVLGVAGQTIAGLVSLGAVVLGWTGVALALRRLWSWRRRRSRVTIRGGMRREPELETAA